MARNPGKKFEEDFVKSIPDRCDVTRLKDAGGWSNATNMRFTSKNPCDFVVFSPDRAGDRGVLYKLELKSTQGKSLPFSNIKEHQLDALCESDRKGVKAWFVINFRSVNETYWVPAIFVRMQIEKGERKSLALAEARALGRLIKQSLIRVRYKYDLEWL